MYIWNPRSAVLVLRSMDGRAMGYFYTYAWARGLWTHWLGPYFQAKQRQSRAGPRRLKLGQGVRFARHSWSR